MANNEPINAAPLNGDAVDNQTPVTQVPESTMPATVVAMKNMERRRMEAQRAGIAPIPDMNSTAPTKPLKLPPLSKILPALALLVVGCIVLTFFSMITGLDTKLVKLTLVGTVVDQKGTVVPNVKVKINSTDATADAQGKFSVGGLESKVYEIDITANGFVPLKDTVAMGRGLLNYTVQRNFVMTPAVSGNITGKLVVSDNSKYKFLEEQVVVGDKSYKVNADGTFDLKDVLVGSYTIQVISPNYKDVKLLNVELKGGEQQLDPISLQPAGDIMGTLHSYITEEVILDADLVLEGVPKDQLDVDDKGNFVFKDLTVGQTYKLRSQAEGYQTRDYQVKIAQGKNLLEKFYMVEAGNLAYVSRVENKTQVFTSEYDGQNPKQLTFLDYEPFGLDLVNNGQKVIYASSRLGRIDFYSVPVSAGNPQQLTVGISEQEKAKLKEVYPNFTAEKFATVYEDRTTKDLILEVRNINGGGTVEIARTRGSFNDIHISENGNYVAYIINNKGKADNGFYRANINSNERKLLNSDNAVAIYDISPSGKRVLYGAYDQGLNTTALKYTDADKGETVSLANTAPGQQYQFVSGSESLIIYSQTRDSRANIYRLNIENNQEEAITKAGGVESFLQQNGLVLYYKPNGLFVLDLRKPLENKLVRTDAVKFTGYKF